MKNYNRIIRQVCKTSEGCFVKNRKTQLDRVCSGTLIKAGLLKSLGNQFCWQLFEDKLKTLYIYIYLYILMPILKLSLLIFTKLHFN